MRGQMINFPRMTCCNLLCRRSASGASKTYYDILGLRPDAKQNEIKAAYYRLSMRHHPDKNKGSNASNELFHEITAAYDTLSNESLRARYDEKIGAATRETMTVLRARRPAHRQGAPLGRSEIYNFDEYYKQHYRDAVKSHQERKKRYEQFLRREESDMRRDKDLLVYCILMSVVLLGTAGLRAWGVLQDRPSRADTKKGEER